MAEAGTVFTPNCEADHPLVHIYQQLEEPTACVFMAEAGTIFTIHTGNCEADHPLVHIYQQLEEPTVCVFMAEAGTVFTPVTVKLRILWYIYTNSWRNPLYVSSWQKPVQYSHQ
jgi:hypothetical protein